MKRARVILLILFSAYFHLAQAALCQSNAKQKISPSPSVEITFPSEFSCGRYFIVNPPQTISDKRYRHFKQTGQLQNLVKLPKDAKICVDLTFKGGERLSLLDKLPKGSLVGLDFCGLEITDRMFERLGGRKELTYLNAAETEITGKSLTTISSFPNLTALNLDFTYIGDADLAPLSNLTKLKTLTFFNCSLKSDSAKNFIKMSELERLDLHRCKITDDDLKSIGKLTKIKTLILGSNLITDAGLQYLKPLVNLEYLEIDGNKISDKGLLTIASLRKLSKLKVDTRLNKTQASALNKAFAIVRFSPWQGEHLNPTTLLEDLF